MSALSSVDCFVPPEIFARVRDGFAAYFEGINGIDRDVLMSRVRLPDAGEAP
jgi:hypothetical protein